MNITEYHSIVKLSKDYLKRADTSETSTTYFKHNKVTTLKILIVVFSCATTMNIKIKFKEDHSTAVLMHTFSCEVDYSEKLFSGKGS